MTEGRRFDVNVEGSAKMVKLGCAQCESVICAAALSVADVGSGGGR